MKKNAHYVIKGKIELESPMRIGGSDDILEIGTTELTCLRGVDGRPFIPGSSIKGRMRSLLEWKTGKIGKTTVKDKNDKSKKIFNLPCSCAKFDCPICRIFGPHAKTKHDIGPTRIIVHDSLLIGDFEFQTKTEAIIKRDVGSAEHPRPVESVAKGAIFHIEIGLQVFDLDTDNPLTYKDKDGNQKSGIEAMFQVIYHGIDLLEDSGIGAGTGKGYGKIKIIMDDQIELKTRRRVVPTIPTCVV